MSFGTVLVMFAVAASACAVALPLLSWALRTHRQRITVISTLAVTTVLGVLLVSGQQLNADFRGLPAACSSVVIAVVVMFAALTGRIDERVRHRAGWTGWAGLVAVVHLLLNQPPVSGQIITVALVATTTVACAPIMAGTRTGAARRRIAAGIGLTSVLGGLVAWRVEVSKLPASYTMNHSGVMADHHAMAGGTKSSVGSNADTAANLVAGPLGVRRERSFDLTARATTRTVAGRAVAVWGYEVAGQPGSDLLRVRQGDRVLVQLHNQLPVPTTIHWHGIDVPNSADGVAGLTQDAVAPGASYTYTFDADQPGTYWYHSHQDSAVQVGKGLFGAIVVDPAPSVLGEQATYGRPAGAEVDRVLTLHTYAGTFTATDDNQATTAAAAPGQQVRVRLLNTDSLPATITVTGTAFTVAALDGHALHEPTPLTATEVTVPASGRVDLTYTQPSTAVRVDVTGDAGSATYRTGGNAVDPGPTPRQTPFDVSNYGTPASKDVDGRPVLTSNSHFDKAFTARIASRLMFFDGSFGTYNVINDKLYPYGDMFTVDLRDTVEVTIVSRSFGTHPMHLHGHSYTVLAHNGSPLRGTPVQLDSLNVLPGDTWTIAFHADNPGLWMFHCHDLNHAANGMDLMIGYRGITTAFSTGTATGNRR